MVRLILKKRRETQRNETSITPIIKPKNRFITKVPTPILI
jgi:hypothetical protein